MKGSLPKVSSGALLSTKFLILKMLKYEQFHSDELMPGMTLKVAEIESMSAALGSVQCSVQYFLSLHNSWFDQPSNLPLTLCSCVICTMIIQSARIAHILWQWVCVICLWFCLYFIFYTWNWIFKKRWSWELDSTGPNGTFDTHIDIGSFWHTCHMSLS